MQVSQPAIVLMLSLLAHAAVDRPHIDCLFAAGPDCLTWSLYPCRRQLHADWNCWQMRWQRQTAHRRFYTHYTGPVSRHRGRVQLVWQGRAYVKTGKTFCEITSDHFVISMKANGLAALRLRHTLTTWPKKIVRHLSMTPPPLHS